MSWLRRDCRRCACSLPLLPEGWFRYTWIQPVMAVLLTLVVLYIVGRITSLVIGRQAFGLFESILERLPFVAKVYTSVRQLLDTMMAKKDASQRVVLIDFPIAGQKSIGFLTRTMTDAASGQPLAAVLVPNAINPTSAFLQILPMDRVIETDLTMEQAMSMVMTGGAVGPETIQYSKTPGGEAQAGRGENSAPRSEVGATQEALRWQRFRQKNAPSRSRVSVGCISQWARWGQPGTMGISGRTSPR